MFRNAGKQVRIYSIVLAGIIFGLSLTAGIVLIKLGVELGKAYSYDYYSSNFPYGWFIFFGIMTIIIGMALAWIVFYVTFTFGLTADRILDSEPKKKSARIDINGPYRETLSTVLAEAGGSRKRAYSLLMQLSEDYYRAGMTDRAAKVDSLLTAPDVLEALRMNAR